MNQPTEAQILEIKELLQTSIDLLILNDGNIFYLDTDIEMPELSPDAKILNRELHETTINHRLAYYIETHIQGKALSNYNVDIEYNRYFENPKVLEMPKRGLIVRPDIIMHSRINTEIVPQHYLVIEAKKDKITNHDIEKVTSFITDKNYYYVFGLTISYCQDEQNVAANLYYFNGEGIKREELNRAKQIY